MLEGWYRDLETDDDRNRGRMPTSEPTLMKAWKNYRTVAHLWGAFRIIQDIPGLRPTDSEVVLAAENLDLYWVHAEALRQFGEAFILESGTHAEPLLPPDGAWRPPESTNIPLVLTDPLPLPDWMEQTLEAYSKRNYVFVESPPSDEGGA